MDEICSYSECTGCLACKEVCSHNAIESIKDKLGFLHPSIDQNKCINCGVCKKTCPVLHEPFAYEPLNTYAASALDDKLLVDAASGGIASLLSEEIINEGGVVYGCSGIDGYHILYKKISNVADLQYLRGSKYVQSDFSTVYKYIKEDLNKRPSVLVIGISCQLAGLLNYLRKTYSNLYTVDIICHGAASQNMLTQNIDFYKKKLNINILSDISFRKKYLNKDNRFDISYGFSFLSNECEYFFNSHKDMFSLGYGSNLLFRDTCYSCKYAKLQRIADLTIGDFWKLPKTIPISKRNGVSLVITHTKKGEHLFSKIQNKVEFVKRELSEAVSGNPQLIKPSIPGDKLKLFRKLFINRGLIFAVRAIHWKLLLREKISNILVQLKLYPLYQLLRFNEKH